MIYLITINTEKLNKDFELFHVVLTEWPENTDQNTQQKSRI